MFLNRYKLFAEAGEGTDTGGADAAALRGDFVPEDDDKGTPSKEVKDKLDDPADDVDALKKDDTEGEETPEEKAEREAEEAKAAKKANIRVPKARLDEVTAKARAREQALQKEIADLQAKVSGSETKTEVDKIKATIDEMQDKYEDLVQEGKKDEARALRKKVEKMREDLADYRLSVSAERARAAAIDDLKYDAALASVEAKFPALNPDHEDFDEEKSSEVVVLLEAFLAKGFNRATALQKSVKYVMGDAPSAKSEDEKDTAATLRAKVAADARKKNADAAARQPASTSKVGKSSDREGNAEGKDIDVMRLTQDEFRKMDEKTLAKLRGDELDE